MSTFDARQGDLLKLEGMETAALNQAHWLAIARGIAIELGRQRGEVTADDVGRILKRRHGIESLGPAAGSLFRTPDWKWGGEFRKSERVSNHSRLLRVWKYTGV